MKKLYSLIEVVHNVSGVQKVLVDIHNGIKMIYDAKIAGFHTYNKISHLLPVEENEYIQIKSILELRNSIVITHERKICTKCVILNKVFSLKIKHIHVQHSIYDKWKLFSFYPETIVSISDKITENLKEYFKISPEKIHKIHNGIIDQYNGLHPLHLKDELIKIAYVARVDSLKCQIDIVKKLKNALSKKIRIDFIGSGPLFNDLEEITEDSEQFKTLGFQKDVISMLKNYDYVMLYSKKEGLPITLIEGAMSYMPLIVNDIGGSLEIGIPSYNAFLANDLNHLKEILNSLESLSDADYNKMAKNSRKLFIEKFTHDGMIQKYQKLIDNVDSVSKN
jgi:glycosyltransferase involved in cell wall biosynthesis